jgi:hypothetical protein
VQEEVSCDIYQHHGSPGGEKGALHPNPATRIAEPGGVSDFAGVWQYPNAQLARTFVGDSPVNCPDPGIFALANIAPGEYTHVRIPLVNISRRALGVARGRARVPPEGVVLGERRRRVALRVHVAHIDDDSVADGGPIVRDRLGEAVECFRFSAAAPVADAAAALGAATEESETKQSLDAMGVDLILDGAMGPMGSVQARDTVACQFGWDTSTVDFAEARLTTSLYIEIADYDAWSTVPPSMRWEEERGRRMVEAQRRSITLTSVPAFTAPPGMDSACCAAILVYTAGVPTELVRWLQNFVSQPIAGDGSGDRTKCGLGLPTAIWNLQRYGHFDPTASCAASYELRSMMSNAVHLFVVVLDWKVRTRARV